MHAQSTRILCLGYHALSWESIPLLAAGLSAEDDEEGSPLATTRIYAERGRGTFSPPDMLRDSMALFLQVLPRLLSSLWCAASPPLLEMTAARYEELLPS